MDAERGFTPAMKERTRAICTQGWRVGQMNKSTGPAPGRDGNSCTRWSVPTAKQICIYYRTSMIVTVGPRGWGSREQSSPHTQCGIFEDCKSGPARRRDRQTLLLPFPPI